MKYASDWAGALTAAGTMVAAIAAWWSARQSVTAAQQSHESATVLTKIEAQRRHSEMAPKVNVRFGWESGAAFAYVTNVAHRVTVVTAFVWPTRLLGGSVGPRIAGPDQMGERIRISDAQERVLIPDAEERVDLGDVVRSGVGAVLCLWFSPADPSGEVPERCGPCGYPDGPNHWDRQHWINMPPSHE